MRYRALTATGDSTFGSGSTAFLVNSSAAVGQAIETRFGLMTGEWFLDVTAGTDYVPGIIGRGTNNRYDRIVKNRILETDGVVSIDEYSSNLDRATRTVTFDALVSTLYGRLAVTGTGTPTGFVVTASPAS